MSLFGRLKQMVMTAFQKSSATYTKPTDYSKIRPVVIDPWTRGVSDIARLPSMPYFGYKFLYELYLYSDVLRLVIRSLVQETVRKGVAIRPRFAVKCNVCGTEYEVEVSVCDVCKSTSLRKPSQVELRFLESWIHDVNYNDQSLVEVLAEVLIDLNLYDNAFLAVTKEYHFDANGHLVGAQVKEVLRASPELVELIMDSNGVFGRTDDGKLVMVCPQHRDRHVLMTPEQAETARCPVCGLEMFPAYFRVRKGTIASQYTYVYYLNGEMLHVKKFTPGIGFGMSPVYSIWMKLVTLMKQDYFILTAYSLERPPKALLILKGNIENIERAFRRLMEEARTNPHMIYPLIVEPTPGDGDRKVAEFIDLTYTPKDIDFIAYREEVRKTIGAIWGVMPIFSGDVGGGAGLANEGLQIVVTNRAVEREQNLVNTKILDWLRRQLGVSDWDLILVPNEGRDMVARIQRERMRIDNALSMMQLGYKPIAVKTEDGIDFDYVRMDTEEPVAHVGSGGVLIRPAISERKIPRYEGEPEHGRPRTEDQRFEGEELGRRHKTPSTFIVGEGGELIPEEPVEGEKAVLEKQGPRRIVDVPPEYRRYIHPEQIPLLPPGTRVHRGPRGGLFIDRREVPRQVQERLDETEEEGFEERREREEEPEIRRPERERRRVVGERKIRLPGGRRLEGPFREETDQRLQIDLDEDLKVRDIVLIGEKLEVRDVPAYRDYVHALREVVRKLTGVGWDRPDVGMYNIWADLLAVASAINDGLERRLGARPEITIGRTANSVSTDTVFETLIRGVPELLETNVIFDRNRDLSEAYNLDVFESPAASPEERQALRTLLARASELINLKYRTPLLLFGGDSNTAGLYCARRGIALVGTPIATAIEDVEYKVGDERIKIGDYLAGEVVFQHEYSHYIFEALETALGHIDTLREYDLDTLRRALVDEMAELVSESLTQDVIQRLRRKPFADMIAEDLRRAVAEDGGEVELEELYSAIERAVRSFFRQNWHRYIERVKERDEVEYRLRDAYKEALSALGAFTEAYEKNKDEAGRIRRIAEHFVEFKKIVEDDDGLTLYSEAYYKARDPRRYTEAWASCAELFTVASKVLKARGQRLTKDALIAQGEEILERGQLLGRVQDKRGAVWVSRAVVEKFPAVMTNRLKRLWRSFIEIYDALGLVRWEG